MVFPYAQGAQRQRSGAQVQSVQQSHRAVRRDAQIGLDASEFKGLSAGHAAGAQDLAHDHGRRPVRLHPGGSPERRGGKRDGLVGQVFEQTPCFHHEPVGLGGPAILRPVDLRRGRGRDEDLRARPDEEIDLEPVALDDPARWIEDVQERLLVLVLIGRRHHLERDTPELVDDHGPFAARLEGHPEHSVLARREGHRVGGGRWLPRRRHARSSNSTCRRIHATTSSTPSARRRFVNTNGLSPRIRLESRAMTSRLAST